MNIFNELMEYLYSLPVISTHCHHMPGDQQRNIGLKDIFENSYVGWCNMPLEESKENIKAFTHSLRHNSYFHWLEKSLQEICGIDKPINEQTYFEFDDAVRANYADADHHLRILKDKCNYRKVVLDPYWNPGDNLGHPELFTPTFRVDVFMSGYSREAMDRNDRNPFALYGWGDVSFDEYLNLFAGKVREAIRNGCVSLKCAMAYERPLNFTRTEKAAAAKGYFNPNATAEDIRRFQDYIFFTACELAGELDVPFQIHTGLGKMENSRAIELLEVIDSFPGTRFDLFHGSYPWMSDVCGLVHNYGNVYADLCWLPLISTTASVRFIKEILEVGNLETMMWGCDAWRSEESFGGLLAARYAVAKALSQLVEDQWLGMEDAKEICRHIMYKNAEKAYKLSDK